MLGGKATMTRFDLVVLAGVVLLLGSCFGVHDDPTMHSLTIQQPFGEGTTTPPEGRYQYEDGALVELEARPAEGWVFCHWSGDEVSDPEQAETLLTMDGSKTVQAVFQSESASVDRLEPGGTITGVDGVSIGAMEGAIDDGLMIQIKRVADPRTDIALPRHLAQGKVLGDFYEISAAESIRTPDGEFFILGMPVPEQADIGDLAILILAQPGTVMSTEPLTESDLWYDLTGTYDEEHGLFLTGLRSIGAEPESFALVQGLGHLPWDLEALSDNEFYVKCRGFDTDECNSDHITVTENVLQEALDTYRALGFDEPRLSRRRKWSWWPPGYYSTGEYRYELRKTDPDYPDRRGVYKRYPHKSIAITYFDGVPDEPVDSVAWHELFHAVQNRYLSWWTVAFRKINWGYLEGTAVLAQGSLRPPTRYNFRQPFSIETSLLGNRGYMWGSGALQSDYRTVDFWTYLGRHMDTGHGNSFLLEIVEEGGSKDKVDTWLADNPPFEGLGDAYWQFIKDYSFEKQTTLGTWRGHTIPRAYTDEWWSEALGDKTANSVSLSPLDWQWTGQDVTNFYLEPLSSRAIAITLEPDAHDYEVTLDVATTDPHIEYKFYHVPGSTIILDNSPQTFSVEGKSIQTYVLLSNTDLDATSDAISLVVEETPRFELNIEMCERIESRIASGALSPEDVVDPVFGTHKYVSGTEVTLRATRNPTDTLAFWSWGGDCQATLGSTSVTVVMDQDRVVTPHYFLYLEPIDPVEPIDPPLVPIDPIKPVAFELTIEMCERIEERIESGVLSPEDVVNPVFGTHSYPSGTEVTLQAARNPTDNLAFWSWGGDCKAEFGSTNVTVVMDQDRVIIPYYLLYLDPIDPPFDPILPPFEPFDPIKPFDPIEPLVSD